MKHYVDILQRDAWSGRDDVTPEEHAAACERMEAWLTEHEGAELSISVRPARRGEVAALREIDDYGREIWTSQSERADLHELLGAAWEHACQTWPRDGAR